jgi:flagellar biogenesis protein FliO
VPKPTASNLTTLLYGLLEVLSIFGNRKNQAFAYIFRKLQNKITKNQKTMRFVTTLSQHNGIV